MESSLSIAKTGLEAQQTRLSIVSNNLANANTTGFKKTRGVFEDLLYQNVTQVGAENTETTELPSGLLVGTGVRLAATQKIHTQGNLNETGNALDLAVDGRGFFQILLPDASLGYTRDGTFQLNDQGEVVTSAGNPLQPGLVIPPDTQSVTIGADGTVSVMLVGETTSTQVGNVQLADFINPSGLQPIGENLFIESPASGPPQVGNPDTGGLGTLRQGALETSNVNVVEELVNLIETQRAYEINARAVATADEMLQFSTNNL